MIGKFYLFSLIVKKKKSKYWYHMANTSGSHAI